MRPFPLLLIPFRRTGAVVCICLGALAGRTAAAERVDNPALGRFNRAITFYLSFDGTMRAELARGQPDPRELSGDPQYHPGLYGRAMTLIDATKPGTFVIVSYSLLDNLDVTRPGCLAVWLRPHGWDRSQPPQYFWPVKIMAGVGVQFMFGRMNAATEPIYLWARLHDLKDVCLIHGSSRDWQEGQWHLWAMNWRSGSVEFSLDGGPWVRQDLPGKIHPAGDRAGQLYLGQGGETCRYLLDELLVLDRPLSQDEIKWLYEEGMKAQQ